MFPLRDVLVTGIILTSLPVSFFRPWIGVLVWTWFGVMNPHRMTWDFANNYPFAQLLAMATLAGIPFARDRKPLPRTLETYILLGLWALFTVSTVFAIFPREAWEQWQKVSKIFLFTFIGLIFLQDRARLRYLALILALSIGFFGLKGGLWSLMTGGINRVEAPEGSFLGGNTMLALGLDMALPFFIFLAREESNPWLRRLLWTVFLFSIPAVVFTYSRGGLLGLAVVLIFSAAKLNRKLVGATVFTTIAISLLAFAPLRWFDRVHTIANYESDGSAMSRLMAWDVAFRFALDHPFIGGGYFATAHDDSYLKYAGTQGSAVAHSIWFSVLSEHGFPALILFAALIVCCVLRLRRLRRPSGGVVPAPWVVSYSHMLEISIMGYAVAGSFLNAAYMDVYYWVVTLVILLDVVATREIQDRAKTLSAQASTPTMRVKPSRRLLQYHRLR